MKELSPKEMEQFIGFPLPWNESEISKQLQSELEWIANPAILGDDNE